MATDNHPYWVQDRGWVAAGDLVVGDVTLASDGSELVLVQTLDLGVFANQTVHNLHVAGEHTYYVTADPAQADQLVHNALQACTIHSKAEVDRIAAASGMVRETRHFDGDSKEAVYRLGKRYFSHDHTHHNPRSMWKEFQKRGKKLIRIGTVGKALKRLGK